MTDLREDSRPTTGVFARKSGEEPFILPFLGVFAYLTQIPRLYWVLYVSVVFYVLAYLLDSRTNRERRLPIANNVALVLFIVATLYLLLGVPSVGGQTGFLKRIIFAFYHLFVFIAFSIYMSRGRGQILIVLQCVITVLVISMSVFLLSLLFPAVSMNAKAMVYPGTIDSLEQAGFSFEGQYLFFWASGLSPFLHLFGYQVSAAIALFVSGFFLRANRKVSYAFLTVLATLVAIVSAQRSAILALLPALSVAVIGAKNGIARMQTIRRMGAIVVLAIGLLTGLSMVRDQFFDSDVLLVQERFDASNIGTRVFMQMAAIEIVLEHPLGLGISGHDEPYWGRLAVSKGSIVARDPASGDYALVHNSFLRYALHFGWIGAAAVLYVIGSIVKATFRLIGMGTASDNKSKEGGSNAMLLSAASLALLIQACFHNDSVFTFEPVSLLIFCIMCAWLRQKAAGQSARGT